MNKRKTTDSSPSPVTNPHHWVLLSLIAFLLGMLILGIGYKLGTRNTQTQTLTPKEFSAAVPTGSSVSPSPTSVNTGLVNPASAFCTKQGGTLTIETRGDGGQYGLCSFEDNYACEEWAMFRGECPVGGIRTTGYNTIQQKYCAWSGGSTLATENATCTFSNGAVCSDADLYNGTCTRE